MKNGKYVSLIGLVITLIVAVAFFPSCSRESSVSDQIVVTGIGISKTENGYRLSVQAIDSLKTAGSLSEQGESATSVYTASGPSIAQALQAFLNETGRTTYILHNQLLVLPIDDYAQHSLYDTLDYFIRNLEGPSLVDVVFCREDPSVLLSLTSGNDAIEAEYISRLLDDSESRGLTKRSKLLDVQRAMGGMYDLAVPVLSVTDDTPRLEGVALLRDGWWVGEMNTDQTRGLWLSDDPGEQLLYTMEEATFRIRHPSVQTKIKEETSFIFTVTGDAEIVEIHNGATLTDQRKQTLIHLAQERLAREVVRSLETAVKEYNCDPLGLTRMLQKKQGISAKTARERLSNGSFASAVTLTLTESGFYQ